MKCGNCKDEHATVADVRACYEHGGKRTVQEKMDAPDTRPHTRHLRPPEADTAKPWYGGNGGRPLPFPPGRYAILHHNAQGLEVLKFFHIDSPKEGRWKGYVFVKEQAGDDLFPVKGYRGVEVIEKIAADPREAMLAYGREIGQCGHCGRTLTNDESREYGIGPVCRVKVRF